MAKPNVVTAEEWQKARDDLLLAEKEATRTLDTLAARHGPDHYCPGCTWFTNNVPPNASELLADQGITYATVSDMSDTSWEDSPPGWPQSPTHLFPTTMEPHNISMGFGKFQ